MTAQQQSFRAGAPSLAGPAVTLSYAEPGHLFHCFAQQLSQWRRAPECNPKDPQGHGQGRAGLREDAGKTERAGVPCGPVGDSWASGLCLSPAPTSFRSLRLKDDSL